MRAFLTKKLGYIVEFKGRTRIRAQPCRQ